MLLTVAASVEEGTRLQAVVQELLAPLAVRLELRRVAQLDTGEMRAPSTEPYFARVWIALSAAGSARLYLEHGESDRLLVRDVPGEAQNPELVREELGHILQAAVEGLQAGEQIGQPRQEALEEVAPKPAAVAAQKPPSARPVPKGRATWRGGARYEARWLGEGARFEDGPGALLEWARPLGVELSAYYRRPLTIEKEPVAARLQALSVRALVTLAVTRGLRLGAGAGADFVRVAPSAVGSQSLELVEPGWVSLALARLQATYGYRPRDWLELQLSAGVDLDLSDTSYVFQRGSDQVVLLKPSPVRPVLSLGVALP